MVNQTLTHNTWSMKPTTHGQSNPKQTQLHQTQESAYHNVADLNSNGPNSERVWKPYPRAMRERPHPIYTVSHVLTTSEPLSPTAQIAPRAAKGTSIAERPLVHMRSPTLAAPLDSRSSDRLFLYPRIYHLSLPSELRLGYSPAQVTRRKSPINLTPEQHVKALFTLGFDVLSS
jgi:hypothetical protein